MMRNFYPEQTTDLLTDEATPQAALSLLARVVAFPIDVATLPYAGCAMLFNGTTGTRFLATTVAPWATAAQACVVQCCSDACSDTSRTPEVYQNEASSATGGVGATDMIVVAESTGYPVNDRDFDFGVAYTARVITSTDFVAAPTAAMDRAFELTAQGSPYVEEFAVTYAGGFAPWVFRRDETTIAG